VKYQKVRVSIATHPDTFQERTDYMAGSERLSLTLRIIMAFR